MSSNFFKVKNGLTLDPQYQYGSGDPSDGTNGDFYYNEDLEAFRIFQNGVWQNLSVAAGIANQTSLSSGATSVVITLPNAFTDTSYIVLAQFANYVDTNPEYQPVTITNKTTNTFTAEWNAPVGTANYYLEYIVTGNAVVATAAPFAARLANLADIYVGSVADVANGYADYSSLATAVSSAVTGQKIKIKSNLTIVENVTINKRIMIEGNGYDTYINGNISFTSTSYCTLETFRCNTITLDSGSGGNIIQAMFWTTAPTDSGSGNSINGVEI